MSAVFGFSCAKDDPAYKPKDLCDKDYNKVHDHLNLLHQNRSVGIRIKFLIKNNTAFPLRLKDCGAEGSFFYTRLSDSLEEDIIPPGHSFGALLIRDGGVALSWIVGQEYCRGFMAFDVLTHGQNYVVLLGGERVQWGKNSCGLQIRLGEGSKDNQGNIHGAGHGIDATGRVTSISEFVHSRKFSADSKTAHKFSEGTTMFRVDATFDNGWTEAGENFEWKFVFDSPIAFAAKK